MPNKNYISGRAFEYKVKKYLESKGYLVFRSAGSHSIADLIVLSPFSTLIYLIQTKHYGKISKNELIRLAIISKRYHAEPILCSMIKRKLTFQRIQKYVDSYQLLITLISKSSEQRKTYMRSEKGKNTFKPLQINYMQSDKGKLTAKRIYNKYLNTSSGSKKHAIRGHLRYLINSNKLILENCAICDSSKNIELHHPNYNLQFHVYFLCCKCHKNIHKKE